MSDALTLHEVHLRPRKMRQNMKLDIVVSVPRMSMPTVRRDYMLLLRIVRRANVGRPIWRRQGEELDVRFAYVNALSIGARCKAEVKVVSSKLRDLHELDRETWLQEQSDLGDAHADA